jgi:hypothetical protein
VSTSRFRTPFCRLSSARTRAARWRLALLAVFVLFTAGSLQVARAANVYFTITPGGDPVAVTLSNAGDIAYVTFSGTAGQRVSLRAATGSIGGSPGIYIVHVYRPDGSEMGGPGSLASNQMKFQDTMLLGTTGTYTIKVEPWSSETGTTTLTLYDVPADATASITPGGSSVSVSPSVPGQNGALTFSGTAGQRVFLKAENGTLSGSLGSTGIRLLDPSGGDLGGANVGGSGAVGYKDTTTLPTNGTYTVLVDPNGDTTEQRR